VSEAAVGAHSTLVVVPCGQQKIWKKRPGAGSVAARDAYTGPPFVLNRQYAERFGDRWVILSAKYGLIAPEFQIPGPYEVTFKRLATLPVSADVLFIQARGLAHFTNVIGLGGKEYRSALQAAFENTPVTLTFPFAGLSLGYALQATKRAITSGRAMP
jgi:hypothetical protein